MAYLKIIFTILAAFIANRAIRMVFIMNPFTHIQYHAPGPCKAVLNVEEGSESLQLVDDGVALITSGFRFPLPGTELTKHRLGRILKFDFKNPEAGATWVKIENEENLNPLNPIGFSVWKDPKTGETTVFVNSHPVDSDVGFIEVFSYDKKASTLKHLRSISDPAITLNNGIAATGPNSFYLTNFHSSRNNKLIWILELMGLRWGSIVYYDGTKAKTVQQGFIIPGGIALSPDQKLVYSSNGIDNGVNVYKRNSDNSLELKETIQMNTYADKITVDPSTGDLWVAAHPIAWKVLQHTFDPAVSAPLQVFRISFKGQEHFVEEVFADSGHVTGVYASSSTLRYKDALLVGSVQQKLLYCKIKHLHGEK